MRTSLAIVVVCLSFGCARAPTEILVVVESELAAPDELDEIVIVVTHPDGVQTRDASAALGAAALSLPRSLAMVHEGGPLGPYRVEVQGRLAGATRVRRVGEVFFVPEQILVWRVHLSRACVALDCAERTCDAGACRPLAVAQEELEAYVPEALRDGGIDAGSGDAGMDAGSGDGGDGGSGDAGPVCPVACGADACACEGGCACTLDCPTTSCGPECDGAGTTCTVRASGVDALMASCSGGARCVIGADGATTVDVECRGLDTRCEVDCAGATRCTVRCASDAECLVRCAGATACEIRPCAGGAASSCADDVEVCGTACP